MFSGPHEIDLIASMKELLPTAESLAIYQHHVTANTQLRNLLREFLDLAKCRTVGHQCARRYNSVRMRFNDAAIYARCESEVVRINNEAPHSASLAGGLAWCFLR